MSSTKLNLIAIGTVIFLTAGFGLAVVRPGIREVEEQRKLLSTEVDQVRTQQEAVGNIADLYAEIVELNRRMLNFRQRLPEGREFGEFLNQLAEHLRLAEIENYSVEPRPAMDIDESRLPEELKIVRGTVLLPVRVVFEGRFEAVVDFIRRIEDLPRLTHVEKIEIVNRESRPGRIGVELMIHTYYHPEN